MEQGTRNNMAENNSNNEIISIEISHGINAKPPKTGFRTLIFLTELFLGIFDTLNPGLGIRYLLS